MRTSPKVPREVSRRGLGSTRGRAVTVAVSLAAFALVGCDPQPTAPPEPAASELAARSLEELAPDIDAQIEALGIDAVEEARLRRQLDAGLADATLRDRAARYGVHAVGWFRMGEGGALVKFAKGSGEVELFGGRSAVPLGMKAWSVGGVIGGSASKGVMLVVGLERESSLAGEYRGEVVSATAVSEDTRGFTELRHARHGHWVYVFDVSRGLSANAGVSRVELELR